MLQLWVEIRRECSFRRPVNDTPYGRPAIAFFRVRAKGIAGLEGEVLLNTVDGRKIVVFDLAQL
jgi:hypothetical protein